ncbi:MAG: ATP-binding protein, partial [Candidatus Cloacimonetes bacterium]|nr:ATP-binding protein [Candidatus Cloacimonadota bacterium]
ENFRGIKSLSLTDLNRVNLFVGKNNSGKSTVLEALFLNIGASNPELPIRINGFRSYSQIDDAAFRSFFHDFNIQEPIRINTEVQKPKQYRNLSITPNKKENQKETIVELSSIEPSNNTFTQNAKISGLKYQYQFKTSSKGNFVTHVSSIITTNGLSITQPSNYIEELLGVYLSSSSHVANDATRLTKIKLKKQENRIIDILRNIEPDLLKIEILENNVIYADTGKKSLIPFHLMGDGINRLLSIVLAIFENENGFVMIDEIENGLYFEALEVLWKTIIQIAKEYNIQIFATTHSWENVKTFASVVDQSNYSDVALYRLEQRNLEHAAIKYSSQVLIDTINKDWEVR